MKFTLRVPLKGLNAQSKTGDLRLSALVPLNRIMLIDIRKNLLDLLVIVPQASKRLWNGAISEATDCSAEAT